MVLIVCWLRFFVYFLVMRSISKLILTLLAMIVDTLNFMFIVVCFILIMASIFTTLYQDTNPAKYGGFAITVRYMFDATISNYDYDGMGNRELSHTILIIFTVFFANILLLNYLIAILSTTYENMKQTGIFRYKVNLFQYCERFMTAFGERAYGEIILHPPPLSYMSLIMLPFMVSKYSMQPVSKAFSYLMFWLENLVFIFAFVLFELAISPLAYCKILLNVVKSTTGLLKIIFNCVVVALGGIFILLYLLIRDTWHLVKILRFHQGCRYGKVSELDEGVIDPQVRLQAYNEARNAVISLYLKLRKHMRQEEGELGSKEEEEYLMEDPDFFHIEDDDCFN